MEDPVHIAEIMQKLVHFYYLPGKDARAIFGPFVSRRWNNFWSLHSETSGRNFSTCSSAIEFDKQMKNIKEKIIIVLYSATWTIICGEKITIHVENYWVMIRLLEN